MVKNKNKNFDSLYFAHKVKRVQKPLRRKSSKLTKLKHFSKISQTIAEYNEITKSRKGDIYNV